MTAVESLATLLWRQHELLDLLLFKAGEKQYIVVSDNMRFLPRITKEMEDILTELSTIESERTVLVARIVTEHALTGTTPSLREVAAAVGEPWASVLMDHHDKLLAIVTDIRALTEANRNLIEHGIASISDTLRLPGTPSAGTYTATGRTEGPAPARAVSVEANL